MLEFISATFLWGNTSQLKLKYNYIIDEPEGGSSSP